MRRFLFSCAAAVLASRMSAQSLLYRSPNLSGTWVPEPGVVQFNFLHRFHVSPASAGRGVTSYPTLTLATGVIDRIAIGAWFATGSLVGAGRSAVSSNETEVFARWRVVGPREGTNGLRISITPAYDFLAQSFDGELGLDYGLGPVTLEGAARIASQPLGVSGKARLALAGGAVARLNRYVAVSADLGSFVSPTVRAAWSAGLQILIPNSPHTFAFEASNVTASTIQGNSIGGSQRLYGFEFTIPLQLSRFGALFHGGTRAAAGPEATMPVAAEVGISTMSYRSSSTLVAAGQSVRWRNSDAVVHTVTFDGGEPGSADIPPGGVFVHRFDRPGTYAYHCTPHSFMKGVVVVR